MVQVDESACNQQVFYPGLSCLCSRFPTSPCHPGNCALEEAASIYGRTGNDRMHHCRCVCMRVRVRAGVPVGLSSIMCVLFGCW